MNLAVQRIVRYIAGMTRTDFLSDEKTQAAVEREIMILGEAANNVSRAFKAEHSDLPWRRLVNLRNFYIHAYDHLDPREVWTTAKRLAPRVGQLVSALIPPEDAGTE